MCSHCSAKDVLTILITYSDLSYHSDELLQAVELWTERRLGRLSPQGLSMVLWALAYTGNHSIRLIETAAEACSTMVDDFTPQQLARVMWSFGKVTREKGSTTLPFSALDGP